MRRSSWIVLLAAVMSWPATALAKDAVVPPLLSKGVDPLVVLNLTSLIASELDFQGGFDNVTQLDATPSGMNSACLTSASCLSGIANGNKSGALVGGTVTLVATKYEFNLVYFDAGKIVRTKKFVLPNTPSVIADAMGGYVKELMTGKSQAAAAEESSMGDMDTVSSLDLLDDEGTDDVFSGDDSVSRRVSTPQNTGRSLEDATTDEEEEEARAAEEARRKAAAAEAKRAEEEERARAAAEAKRRADEEARARAAAEAKRRADEEERARAAAEAKRKAAQAESDDIEFAPAGDIKVEEIQLGSAAGMIQLGGDDEEEEDVPPPRATASRSTYDDEEEEPPARASTSRAPTTRAPTSRSTDDDEDYTPPSRSSSSRSPVADADEDERGSSRSSSSRSSSGSSSSRSSSDRDYEDLDERDSSRSRSSTPTRSSSGSSSSSSSSRSRADLDYDELDDDRGSSRRYDDYDLDLDRDSTANKKGAKDDSKVGVTARLGYAGFQGLNFLTYGGELAFSPKPHLALAVGFDAASAKRAVPDALQSAGYPPTTWNTILPIHAGIQGRFGEKSARPYVGADLVLIPGAVQAAEDGSGGGGAAGGRGRVGLDLLLSDTFGLNFEAAGGLWSSSGFVTVEKDMASKGFVPQISAGTVLRF